jgi:hypothetical protein
MSLIFKATQALEGKRTHLNSLEELEACDLLWHAALKEATGQETAPEQPNDDALLPPPESGFQGAEKHDLPDVGRSPASFPTRVSNSPAHSTPVAASMPAASAEESPLELSAGVKRVVAGIRAVLPFVKRILPLFEENTGSYLTSLVSPGPQAPPAPMLPPPEDQAPIQNSLVALKAQQRELRDRVAAQKATLNRCDDQLKLVREATDRNTLEQTELLAGLRGVSKKINIAAVVALGLMAATIVINIVLYLHLLKAHR